MLAQLWSCGMRSAAPAQTWTITFPLVNVASVRRVADPRLHASCGLLRSFVVSFHAHTAPLTLSFILSRLCVHPVVLSTTEGLERYDLRVELGTLVVTAPQLYGGAGHGAGSDTDNYVR